MKKKEFKQIIREEIFRIIKEEIELPDWIDKENNILITMPDGSTETFYFYDDDGEGTSYHASSGGGNSTLTYRNSDDSYEAKFEAYSTTGDPDNPEYDDMEIVSFKNMKNEMRKYIDTFNQRINEIYSDKDMKRGEELGKTSFGLDMKFKGDFRRDKLIIKKLVRLKSKITDEQLKSEIDSILDMLEGTDDEQGAF